MAEIVDTLRLEIDGALRDIDQVERALDRAVAPVELEIEVDERQLEHVEDIFRELERISARAATETQSIALAAGRAEVNFEDMARALDISEDEARRLTTELLQAQAASNRLEDATRDVARQLGLSEDEAQRLTRSLRQADTAADDINVTATRTVGAFGSLRTAAAGIASAFAVVGGAQLFGQALRGANAAIQQFAEVEDSINAVNVVFKEGAGIALDFGETAAQAAGLSELAFNQAVAPIGALLTNFGSTAKEAAEGAVILVQRGADLASVYGGSVQDALLAINSALVGQVEPLRKFGGEISQARVQAFALATGMLQAGQEMDTATAVQARLGLILKDTAVVAGDFANTSDDLANAQRIAAAEAQNFAGEVGEVLAPALEVLVGLLPEVLEGVRQLVPAFAAGADSAAAFFESIGEGGGFRTEFAAIGAGFEVFTAGAGFVSEAAQAVGGLGLDIIQLDSDFTNATGALVRGGALIERAFTRGVGIALANALDKGTDSVDAFTTAMTEVARRTGVLETFTGSFRDFAIAANLTDTELRDATQEMINNADAAGLNAAEVGFLASILAQLNEALDDGGRANADYLASIAGLPGIFDTTTTTFTTFTNALGELPARMDSVAIEMRSAAGAMGESLNPFDEAAEQVEVSAEEFFERLVEEINEQATFQAGIVELIMREQFDLAAFLGPQGPAVQDALTGFLEDVDLAEATNRALAGEGTEFSRAVGDELTRALASGDLTPQMEQAFIGMLEDGIFSNTQVEDAIVTGTASSASDTISSFRTALEDEAAAFDASFLAASIGAAVGASLDFSDAAAAAASRTVNAYEQAFKDDFEISSPSKLMMRLGEEVAAGFLEGAEMGDLQLRTAAPSITGGIATGTAIGGVAGGVNINLVTNNPTQQDQVSDVARMGQIASSIANSWRSVVPNGM